MGKGTDQVEFAQRLGSTQPRDCQHGQLARSCERCADAAQIAELRAESAANFVRAREWAGRAGTLEYANQRLRTALKTMLCDTEDSEYMTGKEREIMARQVLADLGE